MKIETLDSLKPLVEQEAVEFAKYNELPVSLVTAAFLWKLPSVFPKGGDVVDVVCQEETVQDFWLASTGGASNSEIWSRRVTEEHAAAVLKRVDVVKAASPLDIRQAAVRVANQVKRDSRWLLDVTYTPQYLDQVTTIVTEQVKGSVVDYLLTPEVPGVGGAVDLTGVRVFRAEGSDIDNFFSETESCKILLLKQPQSEFYYAMLRGPDLRNWLSYGSYSPNVAQRERSFKTESNVQLKTTTARVKLQEKWGQYADRLVLQAPYAKLQEVWSRLPDAIRGLFPTVEHPVEKLLPVSVPQPILPEEEVQF